MTIAGKKYTSDLKIINGRVVSGWWRKTGHFVDIDDVADILAAKPQYLVLGTGSSGLMRVDEALRRHLADSGISLAARPTAEAVKIFNQLLAEGGNPAAGFHLTC